MLMIRRMPFAALDVACRMTLSHACRGWHVLSKGFAFSYKGDHRNTKPEEGVCPLMYISAKSTQGTFELPSPIET